jgi:SPP1 family predicted phage head-tail adaptor
MAKAIDTLGAMRERVELQNVTEAQSGFPAETWAALATVWAEVKYNILPSKEDAMADKTTAVGVVTFRIRLRTDINEKTRILYRSNYYDIVAIEETPGREFQIIQGEKRA